MKMFFRLLYVVLTSTGDRVPLHCVDKHPNQQHIVATGGQDGMLGIWDVRQGSAPLSLMEAHSSESEICFFEVFSYLFFFSIICIYWVLTWHGTCIISIEIFQSSRCVFDFVFFRLVWEVHFHPSNPNHLFTCSEDGSLLHWETTSSSDMSSLLQSKTNTLHMKRKLICSE